MSSSSPFHIILNSLWILRISSHQYHRGYQVITLTHDGSVCMYAMIMDPHLKTKTQFCERINLPTKHTDPSWVITYWRNGCDILTDTPSGPPLGDLQLPWPHDGSVMVCHDHGSTFTMNIPQFCEHIYHTWILWGLEIRCIGFTKLKILYDVRLQWCLSVVENSVHCFLVGFKTRKNGASMGQQWLPLSFVSFVIGKFQHRDWQESIVFRKLSLIPGYITGIIAEKTSISVCVCVCRSNPISQMLHVWNIYLHLPQKITQNVDKYTIHGAFGYWGWLWPQKNLGGTWELFWWHWVYQCQKPYEVRRAVFVLLEILLGCCFLFGFKMIRMASHENLFSHSLPLSTALVLMK